MLAVVLFIRQLVAAVVQVTDLELIRVFMICVKQFSLHFCIETFTGGRRKMINCS